MLGLIVLSAILVTIFLNVVISDVTSAGIPTKEEQINIFKNVEELFNEAHMLVTEEEMATDAAVNNDTRITLNGSLKYLAIMADYALLKLSCSSSARNCSKAEKEIKEVTKEGEESLRYCVNEAAKSVHKNTQIVTNATDHAINRGKLLMEILTNCSKKPGLQQISCYKKSITSDVFPLKSIVLDTLKIHKSGHLESIAMKTKGVKCVDETLTICHDKILNILSKARDMCT